MNDEIVLFLKCNEMSNQGFHIFVKMLFLTIKVNKLPEKCLLSFTDSIQGSLEVEKTDWQQVDHS